MTPASKRNRLIWPVPHYSLLMSEAPCRLATTIRPALSVDAGGIACTFPKTWVSSPATRTRSQACPCPSAYFTAGKIRDAAIGEREGNESFPAPSRHHLVAQTVTSRNVAVKNRPGKAKP
jgi:hypothetical protein